MRPDSKSISENINKSLTTVQRGYTNVRQINQEKPIIIMFNKVDHPFLLASCASLAASVALWFLVNKDYGVFVGLWVPSILALWVGVRVALLTRVISASRRDENV
jgi:hypothetical protein